MSDAPYLTDASHVLIAGATGSGEGWGGKTATANWWASGLVERGHFDYMIAFDPKGGNFDGERVADAQAAADAISRGTRRLDWSPRADPGDMGNMGDLHADAVRFADGLRGSVVFVHDDAVTYAGADSLAYSTALAGNPGDGGDPIKSIVATQDPWDLPREGVRANLNTLVWVGPATDAAERYFEVVKRPWAFDHVADAHTEPHMWSVVYGDDRSAITTYEPVPERYA